MSIRKERIAFYCNFFIPGLGQFLLGERIKGSSLFFLQLFLAWKSRIYETFIQSMQGDMLSALSVVHFNWFLFHPSFYFFTLWEADQKQGMGVYQSLPFVFAVYSTTAGMFLCEKALIFGRLLGPIWFPLLCLIPGIVLGYVLQQFMKKNASS